MIWKKNVDDIDFKKWSRDTLVGHLGIEILDTNHDVLTGRMPVDNRTKQYMGIIHGGASAAFAETLGSIAGFLTLDEHSGETVVGTEIQASHLRPATTDYVIGKARPIKLGKTLQVWGIEIFDTNQLLVCHAKLTCMVKKISN